MRLQGSDMSPQDRPRTRPNRLPHEMLGLFAGLVGRITATGDVAAGLAWGLPQILSMINAVAGSLFLHDSRAGCLTCAVCHGPIDISGLKVPLGAGLVGRVFANQQPEHIAAAALDADHYSAADQENGFQTKSILSAPVRHEGRVYGVLQALNSRTADGIFTAADLDLLAYLADLLGLAMANLEFAQQAVDARLLDRDLTQAKAVQSALFLGPDPAGMAAGAVLPAGPLSGDFFDYKWHEGRLCFCLGDVAGKGITASLVMAQAVALFRYCAGKGDDAVMIAAALNDTFYAGGSMQFVTFCCGWLDPVERQIEFINCGHHPAFVLGDDDADPVRLPAVTIPLGVLPDLPADAHAQHIALGDRFLFMLTDGVGESVIDEKEMTTGHLIGMLRGFAGTTAVEKLAAFHALAQSGRMKSHDDATLLVVALPRPSSDVGADR